MDWLLAMGVIALPFFLGWWARGRLHKAQIKDALEFQTVLRKMVDETPGILSSEIARLERLRELAREKMRP